MSLRRFCPHFITRNQLDTQLYKGDGHRLTSASLDLSSLVSDDSYAVIKKAFCFERLCFNKGPALIGNGSQRSPPLYQPYIFFQSPIPFPVVHFTSRSTSFMLSLILSMRSVSSVGIQSTASGNGLPYIVQ